DERVGIGGSEEGQGIRSAGDVARQELEDRSAGVEIYRGRRARHRDRLELSGEPLDRFPMVVRDPGEQRRRRLGAVAPGPAGREPGRALLDKTLSHAL